MPIDAFTWEFPERSRNNDARYRDYLVEVRIHNSYTWSKTDPRHPAVRLAVGTYSEMKLRPYRTFMMLGSAPSYMFIRVRGLPIVSADPEQGEDPRAR